MATPIYKTAQSLEPSHVELVFERYCGGMSQKDIHKAGDLDMLSEWTVRRILNQTEPFNEFPNLYVNITKDQLEYVARRRRKAYKRRSDAGKGRTASKLEMRTAALSRAVTAHVEYESAIADCQALGMNTEFVDTWISLVNGDDLEQEDE